MQQRLQEMIAARNRAVAEESRIAETHSAMQKNLKIRYEVSNEQSIGRLRHEHRESMMKLRAELNDEVRQQASRNCEGTRGVDTT